jgi:hypothetical protein
MVRPVDAERQPPPAIGPKAPVTGTDHGARDVDRWRTGSLSHPCRRDKQRPLRRARPRRMSLLSSLKLLDETAFPILEPSKLLL